MAVEWRVIPFADLYEVSSAGQVRRSAAGRSTYRGRNLKPWCESNGYWRVTLRVDGKNVKYRLQRLVALVFIGPAPTEEHEAAHWDGDKSRNVLGNVRWATPIENAADTERLGRTIRGEKHVLAKLSDSEIIDIRSMYTGKWGEQTAIAKKFGVSQSYINEIVRLKARIPAQLEGLK